MESQAVLGTRGIKANVTTSVPSQSLPPGTTFHMVFFHAANHLPPAVRPPSLQKFSPCKNCASTQSSSMHEPMASGTKSILKVRQRHKWLTSSHFIPLPFPQDLKSQRWCDTQRDIRKIIFIQNLGQGTLLRLIYYDLASLTWKLESQCMSSRFPSTMN